MPSASIDTFLACSVMIVLVLSAMIGTSKLMTPYLSDLSHIGDFERFQQLSLHLLLSAGVPAEWGQLKDTAPSSFGLAKRDSSTPFDLDIDKVTRLSNENAYSLTYSEIWKALGIRDVSFRIEVKMLFDISIDLISNSTQGSSIVYEFEVATEKSGMPIQADLVGYIAVGNFTNKAISHTSVDGVGTLELAVPNSLSGTALLLIFAKAQINSQAVAYQTYFFSHNSSSLPSKGAFAKLSPLDCILHVEKANSEIEIWKAEVFSFNYNFALAEKGREENAVEYSVPLLVDSSPMIMVLTGQNGSDSFTEWAAYPSLPLQIGADFDESVAGSRITSLTHVVTISSVHYEVVTTWGGTG